MSVNFDGSQLNRLAGDFDRAAGRRTRDRVKGATEKSTLEVVKVGQQLVVVDTGATKNSIHGTVIETPAGFDGEAGPTTSYAVYLEGGTSRMAPRAFMGPALDQATPGYVTALTQIAVDIGG